MLNCHPVPGVALCEAGESGRELDLLALRGVIPGADLACLVHILK